MTSGGRSRACSPRPRSTRPRPMAKFNVSFEWDTIKFIGVVSAPKLPAKVDFASYEELRDAMDALGHLWEMTFEMPHPDELATKETAVWQRQVARAVEQIPI